MITFIDTHALFSFSSSPRAMRTKRWNNQSQMPWRRERERGERVARCFFDQHILVRKTNSFAARQCQHHRRNAVFLSFKSILNENMTTIKYQTFSPSSVSRLRFVEFLSDETQRSSFSSRQWCLHRSLTGQLTISFIELILLLSHLTNFNKQSNISSSIYSSEDRSLSIGNRTNK